MSDRAWTIVGVGTAILSAGLTIRFPDNRLLGGIGILGGALIAAYGVLHDRMRSNRLSLVFSEDPPYTFRDTKYVYRVEFRLGVRGSRRVPQDVRVLVTNIHAMPSAHPDFRADYPYHLPELQQNGDRELLFQLGAADVNAEGDLFFCGIQIDTRGEPHKLKMRPGEVWDVALQLISADAKNLEAWMGIAAVGGRLKVRRFSWKPAGL